MKLIKSSDIVNIISRTLNLVDKRLAWHGERVAYIVTSVLTHTKEYSKAQIEKACMLALMHDIGAYKTEEITSMMSFECNNVWEHSIYGALFMLTFSPFNAEDVTAVALHHLAYSKYSKITPKMQDNHLAALINAADKTELNSKKLSEEDCIAFLTNKSNDVFSPFWVEKIISANKELHFIEKLKNESYKQEFEQYVSGLRFEQEEKKQYLSLLAYSIDFRSQFMVLHTATTVSVALVLCDLMNIAPKEKQNIRNGALLHDIGKVATPVDILEKPGKLTDEETKIMREHVVLSRNILEGYINPKIVEIAVRHHEKLDGSGYPEGLTAKELNKSQRIVAVADVVSALIRKRSYKDAFTKEDTIKIINSMSASGGLCPEVCAIMVENYDLIIDTVEKLGTDFMEKYNLIQENFKTSLNLIYKSNEIMLQ